MSRKPNPPRYATCASCGKVRRVQGKRSPVYCTACWRKRCPLGWQFRFKPRALAALLAFWPQQPQQIVRIQSPPAHEYVVQATVPILLRDDLTLTLDHYPSDSRVIARTTGAHGNPRWIIYEVCALAAAGDGDFIVREGSPAPLGALAHLQDAARVPNLVVLDIDGTRFSLTGLPRAGVHRRGNIYRQTRHELSLGQYGQATVWIGMRAGTAQLDFVLDWNNCTPGPDRRFSFARIRTASRWATELPDPASAWPYLVQPGNHVIPQQFGRPFRFSVGTTREPERVGVADWSQGGFLPAALPVPAIQWDHGPALAEARWRLSQLLPSPSWGSPPASALWPASGVQQGDEGGGNDRLPLLGARWAGGPGDQAALELYRIEQLRSQARARRRYGLDTLPAGQTTWSFYDRFLPRFGEPGGLADAPWEWDRWPDAWTPPKAFAPHGIGTLTRELNDNLALVWLANDPLAKRYVLESATRARLTFPHLDQPVIPHIGTYWNGAYAQAALAIIAARCLGATQYDGWLADFAAHLRLAQMPSGIFQALDGGYPSDNPPFFGDYLLASGTDQSLFMLAARALGENDLIYFGAQGMVDLGTDDDDPGWYYFFPVGPRDGTTRRYLTEDDWPQALHDAMGVGGTSGYYTAWDVGYPTALAWLVGSPARFELLRRFTGTTDDAHAYLTMRSWGMEAPPSHTSAPIDQWWPLLGVIQ